MKLIYYVIDNTGEAWVSSFSVDAKSAVREYGKILRDNVNNPNVTRFYLCVMNLIDSVQERLVKIYNAEDYATVMKWIEDNHNAWGTVVDEITKRRCLKLMKGDPNNWYNAYVKKIPASEDYFVSKILEKKIPSLVIGHNIEAWKGEIECMSFTPKEILEDNEPIYPFYEYWYIEGKVYETYIPYTK